MIKTGYKPSIITPDNYVLGASPLPQEVLREDGQWTALIPTPEAQKLATETANCTAFGTINCYEILFFKLWGLTKNFSDRFLGIVAGTFPPGNDPHSVVQAVRHSGLIDESFLPFSDDLTTPEKYYSPRPPTADLVAEGKKFLADYVPGHEWVFTNDLGKGQEIERMKQALKYSPLGVSVFAWEQTGKLFTNKNNQPDTHWTTCIGYKEGEYWIIMDSYEPFIKHLTWNFPFGQVKRYSLRKKTAEEKAEEKKTNLFISIYQGIIKLLQDFIKYRQQEAELVPKQPPVEENPIPSPETLPKPDLPPKTAIVAFAKAIREMEGWFPGSRSQKNNNPGNLKFTEYTKSLGAEKKDKDGFCIFPSYPTGFQALSQFITDAADDKLKLCKQCTIYSFCAGYAPAKDNNRPKQYAEFVARRLGVKPETLLKDII